MAALNTLVQHLRRAGHRFVVFVPLGQERHWGAFNLEQFRRHPLLTGARGLPYFVDSWPREWMVDGSVVLHNETPLGQAVSTPDDLREFFAGSGGGAAPKVGHPPA